MVVGHAEYKRRALRNNDDDNNMGTKWRQGVIFLGSSQGCRCEEEFTIMAGTIALVGGCGCGGGGRGQ